MERYLLYQVVMHAGLGWTRLGTHTLKFGFTLYYGGGVTLPVNAVI